MLDSKVMWNIFSSTGSIDAYLFYKKLLNREIESTPSEINVQML